MPNYEVTIRQTDEQGLTFSPDNDLRDIAENIREHIAEQLGITPEREDTSISIQLLFTVRPSTPPKRRVPEMPI